jgi:hypothetical protein
MSSGLQFGSARRFQQNASTLCQLAEYFYFIDRHNEHNGLTPIPQNQA